MNDRFDDFDNLILSKSVQRISSVTPFQAENFIAGTQQTPYRMVKQCLLEIETRVNNRENIDLNLKKLEIENKKLQKKIQECSDEFDKELLEIDLIYNKRNQFNTQKTLTGVINEIEVFLTILKKYVKDEKDLEYYLQEDPVEEQKYWKVRLAKQAAMDIMSSGRIGAGNMEAITQMSEENQVDTLKITLSYTNNLTSDLNLLAQSLTRNEPVLGMNQLLDQLPKRTTEN